MKNYFISTLFATCLLISNVSHGEQYSEEKFCSQVTEIVKKLNAEGSSMVDTVTRQDGAGAVCSLKSLEFKKFINVTAASLREGWQGLMQEEWNQVYCQAGSSFRAAIYNGWTVTQLITFSDGEQHRTKAMCK